MLSSPFTNVFDRMLSMHRAFDQALGSEGTPTWGTRPQFWLPVVDVYETDSAFVIEADLPGVHQENVDISFEQGTLTIRGTRAPTVKTPEKGELRVFSAERVSGSFIRSVRLPEYVDSEKIEATYDNGVLTVHIPVAEKAKPRKIEVSGASGEKPAELAG